MGSCLGTWFGVAGKGRIAIWYRMPSIKARCDSYHHKTITRLSNSLFSWYPRYPKLLLYQTSFTGTILPASSVLIFLMRASSASCSLTPSEQVLR